jgi:pimeloyl-ACP methyl ester carboxylesterase
VARQLNDSGWRTVIPDLRGSGATRFLSSSTTRDGAGAALTQDALDLADGLGLQAFAVVGHDWGARVAYHLAALVPERITAIAALAVAYQPRAEFVMPDFAQARRFWYQWLMYSEAGAQAVRRDPIGFARIQWDTWSPPGWFNDDEFSATARSFTNPDWVDITLSNYRARFRPDEPGDPQYNAQRRRLADTKRLTVPTLMIQGGADSCDAPHLSEGLDDCFSRGYRRIVVDGVGHFPHRENTGSVTELVDQHLRAHH